VYVIALSATDWLYFDLRLPRIWRDGEAICLPELFLDSERRESRLGMVGCIVRLACLAV